MLRPIYLDDKFGRSAIKVHDISADDALLENFHRVFAEKQIPEFALMGRHFSAKMSGIFQLTVIFWYDHFALSVAYGASSPRGRAKALSDGYAASSPRGRAK